MQEGFLDKVQRRLSSVVVTQRVPLRLDRAVVSFSFDDIPESAAEVGARILEERGVRGTFYVCGGLAGQEWPLYRLASLDQIAALARAGHEIGCHTAHHLASARVGRSDMLRDLDRNAEILEPLVGKLTTFAYPYGSISPLQKLSLQRRFAACRGVHGRMMTGSYDRGRLLATALENNSIDEAVIDALLDTAVSRNAWLSFYSHDVQWSPTRFGVSPDLLAYAVDAALARGCIVETMRAALSRNDIELARKTVGA